MPIRFRCQRCNKLLGIARRKAGSETTCPHCGATITVPADEDEPRDRAEVHNLDDIDALLNPFSAPAAPLPLAPPPPPAAKSSPPPPPPAPAARPAPAPDRPKREPRPEPLPLPEDLPEGERPLFERDVDAVLGATGRLPEREPTKPPPRPTSGMDAMSVEEERGQIVLSSQKATALAVVVVLLIALSFAAGFMVASPK
jgi:phage FluMu protein Com